MIRFINLVLKRIMDLVASIIGIIILLPVYIIISIAIKIDSKGPILFKQKRIGKKGKEFYILKFRTMIVGAENIGDGLTVKSQKDNRITKVGAFLRKTSLDEIPQLFNVLLGSMSVVGPRPPVTYYPYDGIENYPEWTKKRFEVKPGITGLSQIKVRNNVSWEERIFIDNLYVNKNNIFLDILIIFKTAFKMFERDNIYGENVVSKGKTSIRILKPSDFKTYFKWKNNKEVYKFLGGGYSPITKKEYKKHFKNMLKDKQERYTIIFSNIPIGMIGAYNIKDNSCEVGMYIGETMLWGKGYASEAYDLFEKEMKQIDIEKIRLQVVDNNEAGKSFWLKKGFIKTGLSTELREIDGKTYNLILMEKKI